VPPGRSLTPSSRCARRQALACAPGAHAGAVARLQAQRREAARAQRALAAELGAALGAALAARAAAEGGVAAYHRRAPNGPGRPAAVAGAAHGESAHASRVAGGVPAWVGSSLRQ